VTRWLAGSFQLGGSSAAQPPGEVFAPEAAHLVRAGPLSVAHTGEPADARSPLCLLDGFLDNRRELATQLGLAQAATAEQVIAAGWARWGSGVLERMRGDFALLIWDESTGEGLVARDQIGVRSMFLHRSGGTLRFASEIRHLINLLPSRPAPDATAVAHWITMSQPPGMGTLYSGVTRLAPGSALILGSKEIRESRYWTPRFAEPLAESEAQLAERIRASLEQSVGRRLAEGGRSAVLMSGGLDSSSVAAVASTLAPGSVRAQAAIFPEHPGVDESELISELRRTLRVGGTTAEVRAGGLLASALESTEAWGLPLRSWGDFWALPLLRDAAEGGASVTLGGDGGDELFGARSYLIADRLRAGHPLQALALVKELPGAGDRPARRDVARIFATTGLLGALPRRLDGLAGRFLPGSRPPSWLLGAVARSLREDEGPHPWKELDGPLWWAEIAHGLTAGAEQTGVFDHQRRRAASAGLQARHPLFDLDLIELCLRLPPAASFDRYRSRPLLRAAMAGLLPDSVRMRPQKALFDSLLIDCLTGPDGELIRAILCDPQAEIRAYVDQAAMERAVFGADGAPAPSFAWMWQLWRLATVECWLRRQRGAEGIEDLVARASAPRVRPIATEAGRGGPG
jgi:asparagine synthase (glutamine-hydrolysing)